MARHSMSKQISTHAERMPSKPSGRVRKRLTRLLRRAIQMANSAVARVAAPEMDTFSIGDRLTIGPYSYGKPRVRWYEGDTGRVSIGSFCSLADDIIMTIGGNHPVDWPS